MRIIVAGGGAAGMMAAAAAADVSKNNEVMLLEKNEKLGKKLFITGKGRCNLTNACDESDFLNSVISNPKFLYSAFYGFTNKAVMDFFEGRGLALKVERGERVFPASDHSSDVIRTLERDLKEKHVDVRLNTGISGVSISDEGTACGVITDRGERLKADRVILALGGVSYPGCGATDDGFRIASELGIETRAAEASLVPLTVMEEWCTRLQGLSLKNVAVRLEAGNRKPVYSGFGEMLFTHFGVSGPLILSASSYLKEDMYKKEPVLHIDLKPAINEKQLDERILRDFSETMNKQFGNSLGRLLPAKLIPVITELSGIDPKKKVNEVTREEREGLVSLLKDLRLTITGNRGFNEAIITRGGVRVKEINPSTMESKRIKHLYFAGEMIDVDALTGGFNLQIAWSTGRLAGESAGTAGDE
ncbi:MAG: NAD(P)/FAD-dependent oxidoreductase [Lachnospiraceae bacterium]|nr:NAD(P)/FAD-dependent oxidoreductase [Lachnospiraceae bacterium]